MKLIKFNKQYKYKSDNQKFGFIEVWDIPELQQDGFYYGDCEDYCIFLKHNIEEFEEWDYYYCALENQGHCVLMKDDLIIDCNCQKVMSSNEYKKIYNVSNFKKIGLFTVFSKFVFGKLFSLFAIIK